MLRSELSAYPMRFRLQELIDSVTICLIDLGNIKFGSNSARRLLLKARISEMKVVIVKKQVELDRLGAGAW
jgi:hypothetical protein